jgi:hypothetical protein
MAELGEKVPVDKSPIQLMDGLIAAARELRHEWDKHGGHGTGLAPVRAVVDAIRAYDDGLAAIVASFAVAERLSADQGDRP